MDAAAEPGEPPEQVAVPGFAFIWTAEKTDTFCSLCGHPLVKGLDMAKLDDGAAKDGALRCFYPPKGNSAWSHVACFATTHVWRARAGLEAPQQRPAWKTPVVASRSRNLCVGPAYWRPSEEQVGAYRWVAHGSGSAVVVARAGSGKTATLAAAMTLVEAARCNYPRSFAALYNNPLVLAFNRHNQADLVRVISPFTAEVRTFHSYAWACWRNYAGRDTTLSVKGNKMVTLLLALYPDVAAKRHDARFSALKAFVKRAVSLAKSSAMGLEGGLFPETPAGWEALHARYAAQLSRDLEHGLERMRKSRQEALKAQAAGTPGADALLAAAPEHTPSTLLAEALAACATVLAASTKAALDDCVFDYDDMIYIPLAHEVHRPNAPRVDWHPRAWVVVDEAQDVNAARRLMVRRVLKADGRLLAVGDPAQALYGFAGADSAGMAALAAEHGATQAMTLSACFRCPRLHLSAAAALLKADEGTIRPRDGAPRGRILTDGIIDDPRLADRADSDDDEDAPTRNDQGGAVLCRANAPLLALFRALIRDRREARLVGARDVGPALHGVLRAALHRADKARGTSAGEARSYDALLDALQNHAAALREKADNAEAADPEVGGSAAYADDYVQCLLMLLSDVKDEEAPLDALRKNIDATYPKGEQGDARHKDAAASVPATSTADDSDDDDGEAVEADVSAAADAAHADADGRAEAPGDGMATCTGVEEFRPKRGELVLCTVHKAKGREWHTVYLLQPDWLEGLREAADAAAEADQACTPPPPPAPALPPDASPDALAERNVAYVAATRATRTLVLLRHSGWPFNPALVLKKETVPGAPIKAPETAEARAATRQGDDGQSGATTAKRKRAVLPELDAAEAAESSEAADAPAQ